MQDLSQFRAQSAATRSRADWRFTDIGSPDSPAIVLLHSLGLDRHVWHPVAKVLSPRFRLIVPDLPGHGIDAATAPLLEITDAADQVMELVGKLGLDRVLVAGISMGGAVAQEVVLRHPEHVVGLALVATMPKGVPVFLERASDAETNGLDNSVSSTLERWFRSTDLELHGAAVRYAEECMTGMPVSAWAAAWRALARHNAQDRLHLISCPTLCLAGERDPSTPPALVESIAKAILNASFNVVADAPHLLTLTHAENVAAQLSELAARVATNHQPQP
jgi:pimeloyl-ACP methyl ester carboxylesterase